MHSSNGQGLHPPHPGELRPPPLGAPCLLSAVRLRRQEGPLDLAWPDLPFTDGEAEAQGRKGASHRQESAGLEDTALIHLLPQQTPPPSRDCFLTCEM